MFPAVNLTRFLARTIFLTVLGSGVIAPALAQLQTTGLPLPRFVSLRAPEVNMRTGPGVQYPVEWVYRRRYLPVEIIAEYGTWRKVQDWQGTQGWIHQSMLTGKRTLIVTGATRTLRRRPDSSSAAQAKVEIDSIGDIRSCRETDTWCRVDIGGYDGWFRRVDFWGAYDGEKIE